jgi:SpoVK/Ycf46/Vps4 family AAA+-type ATPase
MKTLAVESGGFSGAEIVSICREAALYAIEEIDTQGPEEEPMIRMKHIYRSLKDTKRQITSQMLEFYKEFGSKK